MNNIYKISLVSVIGLATLSANISAQTAARDTTLNRQINLEREYTPTIQDASKVNTLPALHQPQKKQYDIKFENAVPSVNFASYPVGDTGSGDIQTEVGYSKHRGYLVLGAGLYTNLEGALGYRIVDGSKDQLDLFANHSSTNARIKYQLENSYFDKVKAKDMENFVKLKYSHNFDPATWYLSGSFLHNGYNYYGNPSVIPSVSSVLLTEDDFNMSKNQTASSIELETGIASKDSDKYTYSGHLRYNRFSSKYGPDLIYDGVSANLIDAFVDIMFPIINDFKLGVRGGVFYQGADDVQFMTEGGENPFHSLTVFKANPYFNINGDNFAISLGANFNYALDNIDKTQIAPSVKVMWNFEEKSIFYLTVDGGINDNNLVSIFKENKYVDPSRRIHISRTPYDGQIGVKSGVIKGFEFDIFGGYKYTKDEHFYTQTPTESWGNVSDAIYGNLGTGHFGAAIKTRLIPYTDLSVKATGYFYNLKEYTIFQEFMVENRLGVENSEKKAWGLPNLTLNFNADFSFIDNLTLTANYLYEGGRKTYINWDSYKMDAINELNFKANYQISDWLSVYAKANNVLNQKYERYYGYTLQGISALGGLSLKF